MSLTRRVGKLACARAAVRAAVMTSIAASAVIAIPKPRIVSSRGALRPALAHVIGRANPAPAQLPVLTSKASGCRQGRTPSGGTPLLARDDRNAPVDWVAR